MINAIHPINMPVVVRVERKVTKLQINLQVKKKLFKFRWH